MTLFKSKNHTELAIEFVEDVLQKSGAIILAPIDPYTFREAALMIKTHRDKDWSFTDCTSFAIMRQLKIPDVFCFDPHFEQAGFARLPQNGLL